MISLIHCETFGEVTMSEIVQIESCNIVNSSLGGAIIVGSCDNPEIGLQQVKHIMSLVAAQSKESWPDDEQWKRILPQRFVETTLGNTDDMVLADERLCSWEGWLGSLQYRDWEWLGSRAGPNLIEIQIRAHNWPYNPGPLVYLLYYIGASNADVVELD